MKNALRFQRQHQATFNCMLWSRATVVKGSILRGFSFDVMLFAVLPAHGIWQLTGRDHGLANEWVRCSGQNKKAR